MHRLLAAALAAAVPGAVSAQGLTTSIGFAVVSDYVSGGETQTDGHPAFQPYIEVETAGGLYLGVWASNVDFGGPDNAEIDLYAGWRHDFGPVSLDLGYFRYYYDDSGFDSHEVIASFGYSLTESVSMNSDLSTDFDGGYSFTQGFEVALPQDFSVSGEVAVDNDGFFDWNLGVGKSLTDTVSLDLRYHDSEATDPRFTLGVSFDTSFP